MPSNTSTHFQLAAHRLISMYLLFAALFATLSFQVQASPVRRDGSSNNSLKLTRSLLEVSAQRRDVIVPKIIKPDSASVWPVGSTQIVTWDTSDFPPDEQITNPIGRVVLGHDSGDSLNLDFQNPLAQGFKLRDGRVSVVVPDVPARNDYLIVLMGDSGNTSPTFAITRITDGANSTTVSSAPRPTVTSGSSSSSIVFTGPIPITGTTITGGTTTEPLPTFTDVPSTTTPAPTPTSPSSASQSSTSSPSTTGTAEQSNQTNTTSAGTTIRGRVDLVSIALALALGLLLGI